MTHFTTRPINLSMLLATSLLTAMARAQDPAQIPPPKLPLVAPVPTNADWTVTVKYPAASPSRPGHPDGRLISVHSTKTGSLKRDLISYAGGKLDENWYANSLLLYANTQGGVSVNDVDGDPPPDKADPNPSVANGFPGVAWLRLDRYDRVVSYDKQPCYHYADEKSEAWIDIGTGLPVAYQSGDLVFCFTFNASPSRPLTLPPEYQKAFEFCQGAIDRRREASKVLSGSR